MARRRLRRAEAGHTRRVWPWVAAGALLGSLVGVVWHAPAAWLAEGVAAATDRRLLLADARGSVWTGSAVAVLTGGPGSRDASALPGRLQWRLAVGAGTLLITLAHEGCIAEPWQLAVEPGFGRLRLRWPTGRTELGRWPAAWLAGLGMPFNALRPGGQLRLSSDALVLESAQGRWRLQGRAELELLAFNSALAPLDSLGSYRLVVSGDAAGNDSAKVQLGTMQGPLQLQGNGQWAGPKLRFRGEASADPEARPMLNNLLNLLGPRRGDVALLAIG